MGCGQLLQVRHALRLALGGAWQPARLDKRRGRAEWFCRWRNAAGIPARRDTSRQGRPGAGRGRAVTSGSEFPDGGMPPGADTSTRRAWRSAGNSNLHRGCCPRSRSTVRSIRCSGPSRTSSGTTRRRTTSCSRSRGRATSPTCSSWKDVQTALANFFASGVLALGKNWARCCGSCRPACGTTPNGWTHFFSLLPRDARSVRALAREHDERVAGRSLLEARARLRIRHAVEVRHPSFVDAGLHRPLLRRHHVALVVADTAGRWPLLEDLTADFVYLRLHGDKELYASGYGDAALDRWAARIDAWRQGRQVADARSWRQPPRGAACATCSATSTTTSRCTPPTMPRTWRCAWAFRPAWAPTTRSPMSATGFTMAKRRSHSTRPGVARSAMERGPTIRKPPSAAGVQALDSGSAILPSTGGYSPEMRAAMPSFFSFGTFCPDGLFQPRLRASLGFQTPRRRHGADRRHMLRGESLFPGRQGPKGAQRPPARDWFRV
jgi:uncharacterized protein YecE (DUF72 family)